MITYIRSGVIAIAAVACTLLSAPAMAQCRPPGSSHEARLLAFYEAPTAFSMSAAPERLSAGSMRVSAEVIPVPSPNPALQHPDHCYQYTTNNTKLASLFGRPRFALGLPGGFALEGSYLPSIVVSDAQANLASLAVSRSQDLPLRRSHLALLVRAHGTIGSVRGPITCPRESLQTDDAGAPCFGREPSRDTFHPNAFGIETALGAGGHGRRIAAYLGGGASWLRPRFQAGFVDALGNVDRTGVDVDLLRGSAFAGATVRLRDRVALSAQAYAVPADVTTMRVGIEYRLR